MLDAIQGMGDRVLRYAEITEIATSFGVRANKVKTMLSVFHDIGKAHTHTLPLASTGCWTGEVLYFDTDGLSDWVISPPQVTVKYFTPFIRDFGKHQHSYDEMAAEQFPHQWKLLTNYGVLLPELVSVLLADHPLDVQQFLVRLMSRFCLLCEIPVSNAPSEFLVPALLPEPPAHIVKEASVLDQKGQRRFSVEFGAALPAGFFEAMQSIVVKQASILGAVFPPIVFRHVAVVCWGVHGTFRIEQRWNSIVVDVLSKSAGHSTILTMINSLLVTLVNDFFHGRLLWSIRLQETVDGKPISSSIEDVAHEKCPNVHVFSHWLPSSHESPLQPQPIQSSGINWVHAKLGAALSSAYIGRDLELLVYLFGEYWDTELQKWAEQGMPGLCQKARLLLWARPASAPTAELEAKDDPGVFIGQNFEQLTSLLCGQLFASTEDGGTWFWPSQRWQQQEEDGAVGGKRALWACYSAALVQSAGRWIYSSRERQRELTVVLCVYGSTDEALWNDYIDARHSCILLNEERCAGDGCAAWREGVVVVVYLINPLELSLTLELGNQDSPPEEFHQNSVLHKIVLDLAILWQQSALCSKVKILCKRNSVQNMHNYSKCWAATVERGGPTALWYLHPPPDLEPWSAICLHSDQPCSSPIGFSFGFYCICICTLALLVAIVVSDKYSI